MNKESLEEIRKKCIEIERLIEMASEGTYSLRLTFDKFNDQVVIDLKSELWNEYNKTEAQITSKD
ncbi:hypothetical protein HY498_05100 [Candidatus Woesearchaeota archaeon]|nr:hypothetical protein [Candidatus Woesearchaeota archaeon]